MPLAVLLVACRLWGIPRGKYHESPGPDTVNVNMRRAANRHTNMNHVPGEVFPILVYGCHLNMTALYVDPLQPTQSGHNHRANMLTKLTPEVLCQWSSLPAKLFSIHGLTSEQPILPYGSTSRRMLIPAISMRRTQHETEGMSLVTPTYPPRLASL